MENQLTTNDKVLALIRERLDAGQKQYGGDIPIAGEDGRDNLFESIEEAIDMSVYLSATLLELKNLRDNKVNTVNDNSLSIQPESIRLILSGLHSLYSSLYAENQLDLCTNINNLIDGIKTACKWNDEDEKSLITI